ncbi:tryptophan 2,3-dioxygenase [Sciscionella marina]|uniref:tryptophan 2,3-dioxygenase n=1 Tax=Sciscionella marina TaxID=508770 RepID=UPI000377D20D|nr:tryptophan 2,3-dioxygenase family protein [Sciscionella marina]
MIDNGERPVEDGMELDFRTKMDYGSYLELERLLSAQRPISRPEHPDELLFIIAHQTTELWFKLLWHELLRVREYFDADDASRARKSLARVKHILRTLAEQWSVLNTLTPSEYLQLRGFLASASGFQSYQYRAVEFILGNKNADTLRVFEADPELHRRLTEVLDSDSVYDSFLGFLARRGHAVPAEIRNRDVRRSWTEREDLIPVFARIYDDSGSYWVEYAVCEDLVDLEDAFQLWRFRHLRTVRRTIGFKKGTGGSSGAAFLERALDLTFFPELYTVRTMIGS